MCTNFRIYRLDNNGGYSDIEPPPPNVFQDARLVSRDVNHRRARNVCPRWRLGVEEPRSSLLLIGTKVEIDFSAARLGGIVFDFFFL